MDLLYGYFLKGDIIPVYFRLIKEIINQRISELKWASVKIGYAVESDLLHESRSKRE